jgi:hypothetical protein
MNVTNLALVMLLLAPAAQALAGDAVPAEFRGDWVPASGDCAALQRLKVAESTLTLVNGKDSQSYGGIGIPTTFFGPDYTGISVVAIPEVDGGNAPFTVYFNYDDKKGVTEVEIYVEMKGPQNAQLKAIQDAAKKLAARFPALNLKPLKKCP